MSDTIAGNPLGGSLPFTADIGHAPAWVLTTHFGTLGFNPDSVVFWQLQGVGLTTRFGTPNFDAVLVSPDAIGQVTHFGRINVQKRFHHILLPEFQRVFNDQLRKANITTEVAWPNIVYKPKKGVAYLKPENGGRTRMPLGFGADGVQLWQGIYQVSVFAPRDTGELDQEKLATQVMAIFPRGMTLKTAQDIDVKISHSTAPAPVPFGDWSNLPVGVHWFAVEPPL